MNYLRFVTNTAVTHTYAYADRLTVKFGEAENNIHCVSKKFPPLNSL